MKVWLPVFIILQSIAFAFLCIFFWKERNQRIIEKKNASIFKDMFELAPYSCVLNDFSGRYIKVNSAYCEAMGMSPDEVTGRTMKEIGVCIDEEFASKIKRQLIEKGQVSNVEIAFKRKTGGQVVHSLFSSRIIEYNGEKVFLSLTADISERKRAEQALLEREKVLVEQNERFQDILKNGKLFLQDFAGAACEITKTGSLLLGTERVSIWIYADDYQDIRCIDVYNSVSQTHDSGQELHSADFLLYTNAHRQGSAIVVSDVCLDPRTTDIPGDYFRDNDIRSLLDVPVWLGGRIKGILSFEVTGKQRNWTGEDERTAQTLAAYVTLGFEIDERKRSEEEREKLQTQLLQAQKMEAVGRLAGRVAHDFNKMLTVIIGHTEMVAMREDLPCEVAEDLEEIKSAANRSADLTRKLLAFARKQTIAPRGS